nr:9kDa protein [Agapanthus velarivirus]QVY19234.1 9kDa protein [Agapanthus velarivirus]QVY19244.1 9kDa protein [Agapanthus velarivirus]QVY19254.1 9kDa protein [Agapanthus velarivirus]QVY19264.1 9kDa protein [Agapanthus velarivirus]
MRLLEEANEDGGKSYIVVVLATIAIIIIVVIAICVNMKICKEKDCAIEQSQVRDETNDFTHKNIPVIRMQCNHTDSQRRKA